MAGRAGMLLCGFIDGSGWDRRHAKQTPTVRQVVFAASVGEPTEVPDLYKPRRKDMLQEAARTVRTTPLTVLVDRDFDAVIDGCAEAKPDRARTWINGRIRKIYRGLFEHGHCHTVEVYDGDTWWAASMASRSAAPSSAKACSTARATPPRSRWCI